MVWEAGHVKISGAYNLTYGRFSFPTRRRELSYRHLAPAG